jgi:hypothetical protein
MVGVHVPTSRVTRVNQIAIKAGIISFATKSENYKLLHLIVR